MPRYLKPKVGAYGYQSGHQAQSVNPASSRWAASNRAGAQRRSEGVHRAALASGGKRAKIVFKNSRQNSHCNFMCLCAIETKHYSCRAEYLHLKTNSLYQHTADATHASDSFGLYRRCGGERADSIDKHRQRRARTHIARVQLPTATTTRLQRALCHSCFILN